MKTSLFVTMFLGLLTTQRAYGQVTDFWQMNAMGCVPAAPSGTTDYRDTMFSHAGRVRFKGNKTGTIVLVCPVSNQLTDSVNTIAIYGKDSTGYGTSSHVWAGLRRIRKTTGHVETVVVAGNPFDTNTNDSYGTSWKRQLGGGYSHKLDHYKWFYFVQVVLYRNTTSHEVQFGGVELYDRVQ